MLICPSLFLIPEPSMPILTSISANLPLTKHYDPEVKALSKTPNVPFRVSSQETEYTNLKELAPLLQEVADSNDVILVGQFKKKLVKESRSKKTKSIEPNTMLIIDVDKYQMNVDLPVQDLPKEFVKLLPDYFHGVDFIFQYSASYYTTANPHLLSGHLFFQLDKALAPNLKKQFLTSLNFIEPFNSQLTLSGTQRNLHYVIDPVLGENSRIVYIAPPRNLPKDHVIVIDKHNLTHITFHAGTPSPNSTLTIPTSLNVEKIKQTRDQRIKELRTVLELSNRPHLFKTKTHALYNIEVLSSPGGGSLTLVDMDDTYIRMNLNNGDSNSYWTYKATPEIVQCFKSEDAFYMKDVDPELYKEIKDKID